MFFITVKLNRFVTDLICTPIKNTGTLWSFANVGSVRQVMEASVRDS